MEQLIEGPEFTDLYAPKVVEAVEAEVTAYTPYGFRVGLENLYRDKARASLGLFFPETDFDLIATPEHGPAHAFLDGGMMAVRVADLAGGGALVDDMLANAQTGRFSQVLRGEENEPATWTSEKLQERATWCYENAEGPYHQVVKNIEKSMNFDAQQQASFKRGFALMMDLARQARDTKLGNQWDDLSAEVFGDINTEGIKEAFSGLADKGKNS